MRRGGRNYYALDVSDRTNPKIKWVISGGSGNFEELGETWSEPLRSRIKVDDGVKDVLIFSGGYDRSQDEKNERFPDNVGRAIYIVDAESPDNQYWVGTGNPLDSSSAGEFFPNMEYSFPTDLSVVTNGNDGLASQIYASDVGGRIWRFDINNGESGADLVDGGIIADLAADANPIEARRFFHPPDLSLTRLNGKLTLNIGIGSGYQAHPLDTTISDNYHMIRYPFDASGNYGIVDKTTGLFRPVKIDDLFDTTDNLIGEGTPEQQDTAALALAEKQGWYIKKLRAGEKILGASATLDNVVRYVTYVPGFSGDGCSPNIGQSFFWAVNLENGTPASGLIDDTTADATSTPDPLKAKDRYIEIPGGGLAPPVKTLFVTDGTTVTPTDVTGVNVVRTANGTELIKKWFWSEYPE